MNKTYKINLCTIDKVKDWANRAFTFDGSIKITSGVYAIDGKSIMGIFSLDLSKQLDCEVTVEDAATLTRFEELMKDFIVA